MKMHVLLGLLILGFFLMGCAAPGTDQNTDQNGNPINPNSLLWIITSNPQADTDVQIGANCPASDECIVFANEILLGTASGSETFTMTPALWDALYGSPDQKFTRIENGWTLKMFRKTADGWALIDYQNQTPLATIPFIVYIDPSDDAPVDEDPYFACKQTIRSMVSSNGRAGLAIDALVTSELSRYGIPANSGVTAGNDAISITTYKSNDTKITFSKTDMIDSSYQYTISVKIEKHISDLEELAIVDDPNQPNRQVEVSNQNEEGGFSFSLTCNVNNNTFEGQKTIIEGLPDVFDIHFGSDYRSYNYQQKKFPREEFGQKAVAKTLLEGGTIVATSDASAFQTAYITRGQFEDGPDGGWGRVDAGATFAPTILKTAVQYRDEGMALVQN